MARSEAELCRTCKRGARPHSTHRQNRLTDSPHRLPPSLPLHTRPRSAVVTLPTLAFAQSTLVCLSRRRVGCGLHPSIHPSIHPSLPPSLPPMPALSVHQQRAGRKHKQRRKAGTPAAAAASQHEDARDAEEWLAAQPPAADAGNSPHSPDALLSPHLFTPDAVASARMSYASASPFPHLTLRPLLDEQYCRHLLAVCRLLAFNHRRAGRSRTQHTTADCQHGRGGAGQGGAGQRRAIQCGEQSAD